MPAEDAIQTLVRRSEDTHVVTADWCAEAQRLRAAGRPHRAEGLAQKALRRNPGDPAALHFLGLIARDGGRLPRALQLLEKAARAAPGSPSVLCDLGLAYKAAGRLDDAIDCQRRVLSHLPDSPLALSNMGMALAAAGRHDEAAPYLADAAARAPESAEIAYNHGNALLAAGHPQAAADAFRRTLARDPAHLRAGLNLGVALKEQGRLADAIPILRAACDAAPGLADAEWNLALALLADGQWNAGWRAYEARRRLAGFAIHRVDAAAWNGGPLQGRTLLVHAEQGLGDAIQFCRWLRRLDGLDGPVFFRPPATLAPLLRRLDVPVRIDDGTASVAPDLEAPLISLPYLVGPAEPFWPAGGPYIAPNPDTAARWRRDLSGEGLTVAIAWQGNPRYRGDHRRSVPLAAFAPVAALPRVRLLSLQCGIGHEQIASVPWHTRIRDLGGAIDGDGAFLDTAAIARSVDLVITSDTSIAHVAGAVGARTWLALPHVPDWRWGMAGETTPWYPTMRLFRQTVAGNWADVFARIAAELSAWTG